MCRRSVVRSLPVVCSLPIVCLTLFVCATAAQAAPCLVPEVAVGPLQHALARHTDARAQRMVRGIGIRNDGVEPVIAAL